MERGQLEFQEYRHRKSTASRSCKSSSPSSSNSSSFPASSVSGYVSQLDGRIRTQLQQWYNKYGRSAPPCAVSTDIRTSTKTDAAKFKWWHVPSQGLLGEELQVEVYNMNQPDDPPREGKNPKQLIIAKGRTTGPWIIRYSHRKGSTSYFQIWQGVEAGSSGLPGDSKGFEHGYSVEKRFTKKARHESNKRATDIRRRKVDRTEGQIEQANSSKKIADEIVVSVKRYMVCNLGNMGFGPDPIMIPPELI